MSETEGERKAISALGKRCCSTKVREGRCTHARMPHGWQNGGIFFGEIFYYWYINKIEQEMFIVLWKP